MIKNKILRIDALMQKRVGRYIIYAIGEIILVMVGILLALKVNNWNESNKQKQEELQILKELRSDLEFTIEELDTAAYYNRLMVNDLVNIRKYINEDLPYEQKLDTAFGNLDLWSMSYIPFVAYESLKNKGIDLISNDSLKNHITKFYEFNMQILMDDVGKWEWSFNQSTSQRMMINYVRRDDELNSPIAKPNNFEDLKTNVEFNNFINVLMHIRNDHVKTLLRVKEKAEELFQHINSEIIQF
ncbi:DUF6090 family protein [Aegicerativicinus sediminis]